MLSRFDDPTSLCAASVLRSIIRQCLKPDDLTEDVERQLSILGNSHADMVTTETLLRHCITRLATLYIVIDSLDEFEKEERTVLLRSLSSIISPPDSKARIFFVGRHSVSNDIKEWFPASYKQSTDCHAVQVDISAYTQAIIAMRQADEHERLILQDPDLAEEIIRSLTDGANGMCVTPTFLSPPPRR